MKAHPKYPNDDEPEDSGSGQDWTDTSDDEDASQDHVRGEIEEGSDDWSDEEIEKAE